MRKRLWDNQSVVASDGRLFLSLATSQNSSIAFSHMVAWLIKSRASLPLGVPLVCGIAGHGCPQYGSNGTLCYSVWKLKSGEELSHRQEMLHNHLPFLELMCMRSVSDRVQLIMFVLYTAINARSSIMCLSERRERQLPVRLIIVTPNYKLVKSAGWMWGDRALHE